MLFGKLSRKGFRGSIDSQIWTAFKGRFVDFGHFFWKNEGGQVRAALESARANGQCFAPGETQAGQRLRAVKEFSCMLPIIASLKQIKLIQIQGAFAGRRDKDTFFRPYSAHKTMTSPGKASSSAFMTSSMMP